MNRLFGAIEAGGTKFVCAVSDKDLNIIKKDSFPTTVPEETMKSVLDFFRPFKEKIHSVGVGSFGPLDLKKNSPTYGYITKTPKVDWENFDLLGILKRELCSSIIFTTDVNAAAYGEYRLGAGKNKKSCIYYTIGTGIGGGGVQEDMFIGSFNHTEMGHMIVKRHPSDDFQGNCIFHNECLEGMAAGPTLEKRLNIKGDQIPSDDSIWEIISYYIAQCAYNTTLTFSPDIIIFGGGVMNQTHVIELIRNHFEKLLNGYVETPPLIEYLVTPSLKNEAGIIGCLCLAIDNKDIK